MIYTATTSQQKKALTSQMGMLGTHSTIRIYFAADSGSDSEHWNGNEKCLGATATFMSGITLPNSLGSNGRCENSTYHHSL
jgi:hypothetical protein